MKIEDYKRAVRTMGDIQPNDRAAITIMLKENGDFFISTVGEPENVAELLDKFADYCDETADQLRGGKR